MIFNVSSIKILCINFCQQIDKFATGKTNKKSREVKFYNNLYVFFKLMYFYDVKIFLFSQCHKFKRFFLYFGT